MTITLLTRPEGRGGSSGDFEWLLHFTGAVLRCRTVASVLDLARDAVRTGLGFDRMSVLLVDRERHALVEHIGTDDGGDRVYHQHRRLPLDGQDYLVGLLRDPRMQLDGLGYVHQRGVPTEEHEGAHQLSDGRRADTLHVSLRTSEAVIGLLAVDNRTSGRRITKKHIVAAVAFANTLAMAVESISLLETRARRIDSLDADLHWLLEIGRRVNAADTLDDVLDIVYDGIRDGLGYERVGIVLFDWERETFVECRGTDEHGQKTCPTGRVLSLKPDSPIWSAPDLAVLRAGAEFYYTDDLYRDTPPDQRYLLDGRPTHNLAVALRSNDRMTGLISVDNFVTGRPIVPDQAGPLLALANQLGTAVERARLLASERVERARLQVLLESVRAVNSTLDSDSILDELASSLVSVLDATSAGFSQVDRDQHTLQPLSTRSVRVYSPAYADGARIEPDQYAVIERVLDSRRPHAGEVVRVPGRSRRKREAHAELIVPLIVRDAAIGVLQVQWNHPFEISDEVVDLCVAIADQASLAINNARLYAEATRRAECDALTGLLNHRTIMEYLEIALALPQPFALLLIDLDDLKLFNDTYGHLVGDAVLIQVARILRQVCREQDRAARYGGDEFAVVLQGVTYEESLIVKHRLQDVVRANPYLSTDGDTIPISVSIGVACCPRDGRTCQELISTADLDMYAVKRSGVRDGGRRIAWIRDGLVSAQQGGADFLGESPVSVLQGLVEAVDAKDRYTREHSVDVTRLALLLAGELDLDEEQRRVLAIAGALHDVGKIALPGRILRKPGRLTAEEYEAVKRHVPYGVALIRGLLQNAAVVEAVAYHHERWDGSGYPSGVLGIHTPLLPRIVQLADAVSAMRLDRPYRRGLSQQDLITQLRAGSGTQFDPALIEPFVRALSHLTDDAQTA